MGYSSILSNFNSNCKKKSGCALYVQLLDVDPQDQAEEEGANVDLDSQRKGKCAVIKTSTRQVPELSLCHCWLTYCKCEFMVLVFA